MSKIPAVKDPHRNVWLQLGLPNAEEHYLEHISAALNRGISLKL
jgi:hypothetical protein